MRLICPSCGAVSSADTFANDDLCRQTLAKVAALPGPLPQATLGYLSLFRAGKARALSWKKALRLVAEIETLVGTGYVHVQGKVDKNCPPSLWAKGMEQMVEQRAFLRLPMESHGYLQKVVWDLADKAIYEQEHSSESRAKIRRSRESQHIAVTLNPLDAWIQGHREEKPTDEEMAVWRKARLEGN